MDTVGDSPAPLERRVVGKTALVAGAGSGIGRAAALLLARHGAAVLCTDLHETTAQATAGAIRAAGGAASFRALDVTSEDAWIAVTGQALAEHGRLDVLVNSAGISFARPVADMTLNEWRRVLAVNLDGVFLGTKHAIRAMRRSPAGGSIINVSSASGVKASPDASAYCAGKAAVNMLTRTAALECRRNGDNIRVNAVLPGAVKTPLWNSMPFFQELMEKTGSEEAAFQAMAQSSPGGRFAEPEEVALAILYLASDESRFVTGTGLVIDDGFTA
jgi:NAD(P)-dependent dehydrogenase (short-subunit alcohol dehydrogenase family)